MSGPAAVGREIAVLVVDDDFRVAALHAEFVNRIDGFTVVGVVHTGTAAIEAAHSQAPDLVLLDLYLPDEDGLSVLGKLREGAGPHPDVIAITAARDLPSIRTAMQRGVVHYLVKPFPFRTLAERLHAYRQLWTQTRTDADFGQGEVDRLFGLMRAGNSTQLPKGHSKQTLTLVRSAFDRPADDWSAAEIAEQVGVSRATAQRYLALLVRGGTLELHLRYGSAGRPEHRYRLTR
ncbi:MAG: response regulator [Jatrophihabitantaceae bacterium]